MRSLVAAALAGLVLAGCSSPPAAEESGPPPVFVSTATLSLLPLPVPTSDTMFLLDAPHMMASPPPGPEVRVPIPSSSDAFAAALLGSQPTLGVRWHLPRDGLQVLAGNATLWVNVEGTVTNPNTPYQGGGCFWNVFLQADAADGGYVGGSKCLDEPTVVPQGLRGLRVDFDPIDVRDVMGDTITLAVFTSGIYSDGATVDLLAGSPDVPSRLSLRGLTLPLDTQTYL